MTAAVRIRRTARWMAWGSSASLGMLSLGALGGTHAGIPSVCLMQQALHVCCPTCGLTRSLALLARGDLAGSLVFHPWGALLLAQLLVGWTLWGLWLGGRLERRPDRLIPRAVAINVLGVLALWAIRALTGTLPPA